MGQPNHSWINVKHFDTVMKELAGKIMDYCKDPARGDKSIIHGNYENGEVLFGFYYDRHHNGESHGLQVHIEERGGRVGKGVMVDESQRWWSSTPPTPFSSGAYSRFLTVLNGINAGWVGNTHGVTIASVDMPTIDEVLPVMYDLVGFPDTLMVLRVGDRVAIGVEPVSGTRLHHSLGFRGIEMDVDVLVAVAEGSGNFVISQLPNAENPDGVIIRVVDVLPVHPAGQLLVEVTGVAGDTIAVAETTTVAISNPETLTGADIEWYSTNSAVATVDEFGEVTAVAGGETKIFARITNGDRDGETTSYVVVKVEEGIVN